MDYVENLSKSTTGGSVMRKTTMMTMRTSATPGKESMAVSGHDSGIYGDHKLSHLRTWRSSKRVTNLKAAHERAGRPQGKQRKTVS